MSEHKRAYNKAYRLANWERILERRKKWYADHAERERERARRYKAGLTKEQQREIQRRYRDANGDKIRAYMRSRYKAKREEILLYNKKRRAERPQVEQDWYLRTEYGLTLVEYDALKAKQGDLCAICRKAQKKRFAVDHDHVSGRVRGLLCERCNHGLGHFKDDANILKQAIKYLGSSCR